MQSPSCRVCQSEKLTLVRPSTIPGELTPGHFAITNADYGVTAAIYRCNECGLLQCLNNTDVLKYYEKLQDPAYEESRAERYLQEEKLVQTALQALGRKDGKGLSLLDVGAGSGALVEAAQHHGFTAAGVEPSTSLAAIAQSRGLPVHQGVLPHPALKTTFDVVMLVDVIEHVNDPIGLLRTVHDFVKPGGMALIVTPDVSSFFARLLGFRWWHFRVAHISYFNKRTLRRIIEKAGFSISAIKRPGWYFSYRYLRERITRYLPSWLLPPPHGLLKKWVIPLNLRDSLLMVCVRK